MATQEAFSALLTKLGVQPSDKLVVAQIQRIPAFFDQVTGRFDKGAYAQRLAQNELTPTMFEANIRDDLAQTQAGTAIVAGLRAPRAYAALAASHSLNEPLQQAFTDLAGKLRISPDLLGWRP